jgi:hypothetical protein
MGHVGLPLAPLFVEEGFATKASTSIRQKEKL